MYNPYQSFFANQRHVDVPAIESEVGDNQLSLKMSDKEEAQDQGVKIPEFRSVYSRQDEGVRREGKVSRIADLRKGDCKGSSIIPVTSSSPSTLTNRVADRSAFRSARLPLRTVSVLTPLGGTPCTVPRPVPVPGGSQCP